MRKYKKLKISKDSHRGVERMWDRGQEYQPQACMVVLVYSTLGLRVEVLDDVFNFFGGVC